MTPEIERHLSAGANMKKRDIMINNFLGGVAWGFGTVVGATVIVAIIISILRAIGIFDALGDFLNQLEALQQLRQPINISR